MAKRNASARRDRASEDDAVDSFEVPAAILCASCGQGDCAGCSPADDLGSGVVAIVPWERPGMGTWSRLWATANASTRGAEAFFSALPDGPLPPALRFAVLAELLAVASMLAVLLPLVALALPTLAVTVMSSPELRTSVLQGCAAAVPALALWMVVAHVSHGAALDVGARRQGARSQRRRAVRYGLYACGWDLMSGPLGALVTLGSNGLRATLGLVTIAMDVPGKASVAFLEGVYGLDEAAMPRARRYGTIAAVALAVLSGAAILTALVVIGA